MVVARVPAATNAIGESLTSTNVQKQTAGEASAEDVGHDGQGRIVFVAENTAEMADIEEGLSYVSLGAFVNSGRICLTLHLRERRHGLAFDRPVGEEFLELLAHISSIEIA